MRKAKERLAIMRKAKERLTIMRKTKERLVIRRKGKERMEMQIQIGKISQIHQSVLGNMLLLSMTTNHTLVL
jgi:hypothetical protein